MLLIYLNLYLYLHLTSMLFLDHIVSLLFTHLIYCFILALLTKSLSNYHLFHNSFYACIRFKVIQILKVNLSIIYSFISSYSLSMVSGRLRLSLLQINLFLLYHLSFIFLLMKSIPTFIDNHLVRYQTH